MGGVGTWSDGGVGVERGRSEFSSRMAGEGDDVLYCVVEKNCVKHGESVRLLFLLCETRAASDLVVCDGLEEDCVDEIPKSGLPDGAKGVTDHGNKESSPICTVVLMFSGFGFGSGAEGEVYPINRQVAISLKKRADASVVNGNGFVAAVWVDDQEISRFVGRVVFVEMVAGGGDQFDVFSDGLGERFEDEIVAGVDGAV